MIPVPRDLLDEIRTAPPRAKRLLVTAWVYERSWRKGDVEAIYAAEHFWCDFDLDRIGRITVTSVLMELQKLGLIVVDHVDGPFVYVEMASHREADVA